jgi:hypothetical protein
VPQSQRHARYRFLTSTRAYPLLAELIQSWSNAKRAAHYREQAQKFRVMAAKVNMLELAEQYDDLALRLTDQAGPDKSSTCPADRVD